MTWLRRRCEPFRGYVARILRHRWTRDPTCNVQIPAVCSLLHRITQHQTWPTHRYWFCLSPLWQRQDSPCIFLSLVSIYFIIIYLVCTFSFAVFGSYISGDFKGVSCLFIEGALNLKSFGFGLSHIPPLLLVSKTVRKGTQYPCSHPFPYHNLILHHYTKHKLY